MQAFSEFLKVLSAVLPVFLIALLGSQLRRMDWLTKAADDSLLKVSVNVLLPCLAFSNISNNNFVILFLTRIDLLRIVI